MTPKIKTTARAVVSGLALLGLTCLSGCFSEAPKSTPAPKPVLAVQVVTPRAAEVDQRVAASGGVFAWQEAAVSSEVGGLRIAEVNAAVGDHVRKGQVLARLAAETVRGDVAQQQAAVAEAEAALAQAVANAERARKLDTAQAVSRQELLQYETQERAASAKLQAARAVLQNQQLRLAKTVVVAPDTGTVTSRTAALGQVVSSGAELFRLVRGDRLEWRAEVSAKALMDIRPGQAAQVVLPDGQTLAGTVRQVAPTLDASTRTALVYVDLPAGSKAKVGMFVSGSLVLGKTAGTFVPGSALVVRDGAAYLMSVQETGRVSALKVKTGRRTQTEVEVTEGLALSSGSRIVVQGAAFLNDGDLVTVVSSAGPSGSTE